MAESDPERRDPSRGVDPAVGECAACRFGRRIVSVKQSAFWLCERSRTEPERYPKYPRLPVWGCPGLEPAG